MMRRTRELFFLGLFLTALVCEDDRPLRYALTQDVYEEGYIRGMIFTMDFTRLMLLDSISARQINIEREMELNWLESGRSSALYMCDSLGIVMSTPLEGALQGVYIKAFSDGISAAETYILRDSMQGELDPVTMARASYTASKDTLLSFLEDLVFEHKANVQGTSRKGEN